MSGDGTGYEAARIEVLEGLEAVRKRPGMYIGSTGERGPQHMVFEAVGQAVNTVLATGAGSVDVTLTPDGGVRVADDGPGVPFEDGIAGDIDGQGLEALLTVHPFGPEPSGRHIVSVAPVSVGLFVVNALSSRLTAEVRREGTQRFQEYARGVALAPPTTVGPATGNGTIIAFWPDIEIFETTRISFAVLAERLRQLAFLNRGLETSLTDERPAGGPRSVRFQFPEGVRDFVSALDAETGVGVLADVIGFEREDPRMAGTMEVALLWGGFRWGSLREERVRGFANSRATREGGPHVDGFRDGIAAVVTAYARKLGLLMATDPDPRADQIGEGLTAVVSVKLDQVEFRGATRELLANTEVRACVGEAVQEHLGTWFEEHPDRAARIIEELVRDRSQDYHHDCRQN
ncbi:ATP-binding protein [Streptomyces pseudovenezuelae]|uniref:DNA topoisomerase (ATP-hydrolyzing) n=1 Tax=Streptomyces pseudovenezuelae TaxID=67350 RepID=A0ABT6LLJ3_9ACTN|nr:ATP-binding protein [Streptomyces pseudovenezuelae]MDH6217171.1 DNA gyrase subunit B [Streptomyces pseudovenezuelae]